VIGERDEVENNSVKKGIKGKKKYKRKTEKVKFCV